MRINQGIDFFDFFKIISGFALRLRHSPWANFEVDWRNPKNPLSPKWRKGIPAKVRVYQSTNQPILRLRFGYIYTPSMFIFS